VIVTMLVGDTTMAKKILNHLRVYRRRSAFSQKELAFLLGYRSGSAVPRFERQQRRITLGVAAGYQLLFGAELKKTFPALYERVEEGLSWRMHVLHERLSKSVQSKNTTAKLRVLEDALTRVPKYSDQKEV
jgi:hypothetical protein